MNDPVIPPARRKDQFIRAVDAADAELTRAAGRIRQDQREGKMTRAAAITLIERVHRDRDARVAEARRTRDAMPRVPRGAIARILDSVLAELAELRAQMPVPDDQLEAAARTLDRLESEIATAAAMLRARAARRQARDGGS